MLKAGFFLIAFIVYCGSWSASAEVKDIQKKCEGSGCFGFAVKYYEEKKFDEAFTYSSIACIGDASGHINNACSLVFDLATMDKNRLDKAKTILKQRCELKDINFVEDCVNLAILEQKKGNTIEADNLFKEACSSPKGCYIAARTLLRFEQESKAVEILHKCEALGGHPQCFKSLAEISGQKQDCVGQGKLLERACEFKKKDPDAFKKHQVYVMNKLPQCLAGGPYDTTCWKLHKDSKVFTLYDALVVHEESVYACESLIHHKKEHWDHKESVRMWASGSHGSLNHLERYFDLNDPQSAKNNKCDFDITGTNTEALFKQACSSPKGCDKCFRGLAEISHKKDDCVGWGKLLEQACEFQKKDPSACKKFQDYVLNELPKCTGGEPFDSPCQLHRDLKASTLFNACRVHESSVSACEQLKIIKIAHGGDHKNFGISCAQGSNDSCSHLARYFELNDPQAAKKNKCGFGIFEGCGKIK